MINLLSRYISVGIVNTALHWAVFSFMVYIMKYDQAVSNVLAFLIAVTFSFLLTQNLHLVQKPPAGDMCYLLVLWGY